MYRKDSIAIGEWIKNSNKALLVTGARQIGKTWLIRDEIEKSGYTKFEVNFIDQPDMVSYLNAEMSAEDFLIKLKMIMPEDCKSHETVVFFDEIQKCPEIVTKIKFLVDEGSFKYVMSGSLLGVELKGIASAPVGYLTVLKMYPMDFEEFMMANNVSVTTLDMLNEKFKNASPVDEFVHQKLLSMFFVYLIVGGMPDAVKTYIETKDIREVDKVQRDITTLYKEDFSQYEIEDRKFKLKSIYDIIPAELNKQNKKISVPGFRKGKVPRKMIEKMYGAGVFYEDAANTLIQENYAQAVEESGVDVVSRPTIEVVQIEAGKPFIFTAEVAVRPEVKLGKYKGVQVTKIDTTVSDEEVAAELEKERQKNSRTVTVTDRPIAEGDTAVIDFEGFVDGVAFEGGKGENHPLEIGSHSFIDTFEDQLVGKNAGDEVDVNVTFPEKYQAADLAGKPALFKVKIHEVKAKELPELNDEFAQDVSEFNTLEEYKEDLKKHLEVQKEDEAKRTKEDEAIQKIIDKSTMEIPEAMIKTQCENMVNEFAQRLAQSGLSMEQYMQFSGLTLDKLEEQVRPEAETRIKSSLVLEQIAKDENIEVSEEEIDAEIEKMAKAYGMEADKLKEYMGDAEKESMKRDISVTKAVDLVMENVKERAKAKTKKEKEAEAEENAEENAEE